jgi:hypothetical protein
MMVAAGDNCQPIIVRDFSSKTKNHNGDTRRHKGNNRNPGVQFAAETRVAPGRFWEAPR